MDSGEGPDPLSRRELVRLLALAAPVLALGSPRRSAGLAGPARGILELRLAADDLAAQRDFYSRILGLPVKQDNGAQITVQAGGTRLVFERPRTSAVAPARPVYHFAFNIPENKLDVARRWLGERTPVAVQDGREVFHYPTWNAHSVYFYDPAGNILELIARHDLRNATSGPFSSREILYASEIGVVVDDVERTVNVLQSRLGLGVYRPGSPELTPVGDEHRLLIVVPRGRRWLGTTPAGVFPTVARLAGGPPARFEVAGYPYELSLV